MKQQATFKTFAGIAFLFVLLQFIGCKKEAPVKQVPPPATTTTTTGTSVSPYYMTGTFDGSPAMIQGSASPFSKTLVEVSGESGEGDDHGHDGGGGQDHGGNTHSTGDSVVYITGAIWTAPGASAVAVTTGSLEVRKEVFRVYVSPITSDNFYNLISLATLSFASPNSKSGAYVTYRDAHGVLWTSDGDQAGSTFQITARGANMGTYTTFSGTFTTKLYDGNGNVKTLSNATFNTVAGLQ